MSEKSLSERLKAAREKLGLSQAEAAELWKVNLRTLQSWESGRYAPTGFALAQLDELLKEILD